MTDQELLEKNASIPSQEIRQDIVDTLKEISRLRAASAEDYPLTANKRWVDMYKRANRKSIEERKEFVAHLKHILELRREQS